MEKKTGKTLIPGTMSVSQKSEWAVQVETNFFENCTNRILLPYGI